MSEVTTLDVLLLGRDIQAKGHCKHALWDGEGNHCALGSLSVARDLLHLPNFHVAMFILDDHCGGNVVTFNNAPETTLDDVLAVFDRAIAAERARTGQPEPVEPQTPVPA